MRVGLLGRKVGMTQIYEANGTAVPVTVLECGPCTVLQVRTAERDGYHAVQLGFADKKRKVATQAERGHARKVDAEPKRFVREIRQESAADIAEVAEGQTLTVEVFSEIKTRRRHRHQQGAGLHGRRQAARLQGAPRHATASSGCTATPAPPAPAPTRPTPARASGSPASTATPGSPSGTSSVVRVDPTNNLLLVRGAVPGPNGGFLTVRQTNKV